MAKLIIEDLPEDARLDAAAMKAVTGGQHHGRSGGVVLERRYRQHARFEQSPIVPGLIRTGDLRKA